MIINDIAQIIEAWAPKEISWEKDNVGLQVGTPHKRIKKILVTLDVTPEVIAEANRKNVDLIISHHPLIFNPIKSVNNNKPFDNLLTSLIKNDIALYSAHTNLDFTKDGVSFSLAKKIGLINIDFLLKNYRIDKKIVVYVPLGHVDRVRTAMADAGAGVIGKYNECSFGSLGTGTFRPSIGATPYFGKVGKFEKVEEVRLEMIVPTWKLDNVLKAMRKAHPYDEIAYDIYNIENKSHDYGIGAIGELKFGMTSKKFLQHICQKLKIPVLRYSGGNKNQIKYVAVCGGSGADLIDAAQNIGADAIVTSDITYHRFSKTNGEMLIIDAGHYETEVPIVEKIVERLRQEIKNQKVKIFKSEFLKNQIKYFIK